MLIIICPFVRVCQKKAVLSRRVFEVSVREKGKVSKLKLKPVPGRAMSSQKRVKDVAGCLISNPQNGGLA